MSVLTAVSEFCPLGPVHVDGARVMLMRLQKRDDHRFVNFVTTFLSTFVWYVRTFAM